MPLELWLFGAASLAAHLLKQHTIGLERHGWATAPPLMFYGARFSELPRWVGFLRGLGSLLLVLLTPAGCLRPVDRLKAGLAKGAGSARSDPELPAVDSP